MLTIERLNARDGASHILQGVNLDLVERTTTATLGRNGVGKTTTMRSIMGLVPPTSGCVRLGGIEITGWATHRIARAGIAYVPAGRQIFPDLSVVENIRVVECRPAKIWPISRLLGLFPS